MQLKTNNPASTAAWTGAQGKELAFHPAENYDVPRCEAFFSTSLS